MKILVVDDDPMAGEMNAAIFENMGHIVVLAADGMDAMRQLNRHTDTDVIVSDMNMPMITGIDLFRELREQGYALPFILLTGDDPGPLLKEEPRLDACLLKDFSLEDTLPEVLVRVVQQSATSWKPHNKH